MKKQLSENEAVTSDGEDSDERVEFEGFCVDMLHEIASIVDFRYVIRVVPDGKYGAPDKHKHNEWNGMVRQLIDKVQYSVGVWSVADPRGDGAMALPDHHR